MNQIKFGLQLASIIVGIYIYCRIWKYFVDNIDEDTDITSCCGLFFTIWSVLHFIGIILAVIWAWL